MGDKRISSVHIEKLGHKIQEIRERALFNIISKLNNGVLFDNDLARIKELLSKLFKWFLFEPCTQEDVVFTLMERILKSKNGQLLINHLGKHSILKELDQLHSYLDPKYNQHLNRVKKFIQELEESLVPPLISEVPLSYRSIASNCVPTVESTATLMEGFIQKNSSVEQQMGVNVGTEFCSTNNELSTYRIGDKNVESNNTMPNYFFNWQPLIEADRHILQSVTTSLTNPPHPSALLHSCEFFTSVLLHDFPAEIFLQRPAIVMEFFSLMHCGSKRITNAVLNCLLELTKALTIRILHCNDASMKNYKLESIIDCYSFSNTSTRTNGTSENSNISPDTGEQFERREEVMSLKKKQLSTPKYCFMTVNILFKYLRVKNDSFHDNNTKINQRAVNMCLFLLEELLGLMTLTIKKEIWDQKQTEVTLQVLKNLNEILIHYGDTLEFFRLESITSETDLKYRVMYLYLVHNCTNVLRILVPIKRSGLILPKNLKVALANCLLDVTLGRLYPNVHNFILSYVESFSIDDNAVHLKRYRNVEKICYGMSSTVKFLKECNSLEIWENLSLAKHAIPSIEFHKDMDFLQEFINVCSKKLPQLLDNVEKLEVAEEIILILLSHEVVQIQEEFYRLCHKIVVANIGPKLNMSGDSEKGSEVIFLLRSKILVEIAVFGMDSQNTQIQDYSEDILTYILKCKILVCEWVWNKVIEALIPALPIIACHASKNTPLGKTLMSHMDPDTAAAVFLPNIVMLKCNIQFLFANEAFLREEAFSRLCWLLSSQANSRDLLPRINSLYDSSLANVCRFKRIMDVNKIRKTDHFYQASSLHQVMEVLSSTNVEPVIKRSALNQVSVMMEDQLLHQIFLDSGGLEIVTEIMRTALTETDYRDYPDSILPIVSIMKNICLYHASVREELSLSVDMFYWILRGLFLFFTEERMKQDATALLFMLIFKDYIKGSPSKADFSIPSLVAKKMILPFQCALHWQKSPYTKENLTDVISSDSWCLSSIQIQWNCEIFGGFEELIKWDEINYDDRPMSTFVDMLKLSQYDLTMIKTSSINYCVKQYLNDIQNGTSHTAVLESVDHLMLYVNLYKLSNTFEEHKVNEAIFSHPWESSFLKFIRALPSSEEDTILLRNIIRFFTFLLPLYTSADKDCWIISFLKDGTQCLLDLLCIDNGTEEDAKVIGQELLKLITMCVRKEQHYLDYYVPTVNITESCKPWTHVIKLIVANLKFSDDQHFYNLAYLGSLLSCLVHLTATLGWSGHKPKSNLKSPVAELISCLYKLVNAFHSGKGPSAAVSVMGLNITRNALLVLNHLLAELRNSKVRGWETYFFGDPDTNNTLQNFLALWASRDVVLRAATLQLFSCLSISPRGAIDLANEIKVDNTGIWEMAMTVLVDNHEASIVRENAVQLLANMLGHMVPLAGDKISNGALMSFKKSGTMEIFGLIEDYNFYNQLEVMLNNLFTLNIPEYCTKTKNTEGYGYSKIHEGSENSWFSSSDSEENGIVMTTPALIKSVCSFLVNILNLNSEDVSSKLQERGLVKLLFRALCNPSMSIVSTRELSLYCDILEMNSLLCVVLNRLASSNISCLGTILHTKDCFNVMLAMLNSKIYHTHLPQLVYLRNKLWSEIFNLLSILVECSGGEDKNLTSRSVEAMSIFSGTLLELGDAAFFEALSESISCLGSHDLQTSALTSLTCLLRVETFRAFENSKEGSVQSVSASSLQTLLDSVRTSRTVVMSDYKENCKPQMSHRQKTLKPCPEKYKMNLLEETYFGSVMSKKKIDASKDIEISFVETENNGLVCGAEICKILIYLYDICDLKLSEDLNFNKKKSIVTSALSALLCVSKNAKRYALENGLLLVVVKQLKEYHIRLSLDSVDCLRRVADKKRLCPVLNDINNLIGLLTNFMLDDETVKAEVATLNVADIIHKLWVWFLAQNAYLVEALKMLYVYTTDCNIACQTLPLTSSIAGSGPRKSPTNISLLHAIIMLINKRMDLINKMHDSRVLEASFNILKNCCESLECRMLISKSNLFQSISRLHPAITKRQKPWEEIEWFWLDFLRTFTMHPEGQTSVAKIADLLELVMSLTSSSRVQNRHEAMLVLRNLAFYQPNKARLLSSGDFLNILVSKLTNGSYEEKNTVVIIMWALIANSQKAKITLKSAHLDVKLQNVMKQCQLCRDQGSSVSEQDLDRMYYVLSILTDEKIR